MNGLAAHADVIVIGSGPAGVSAAWPLVDAGVRVLMLDASGGAMPSPPAHATQAAWRADPRRWRHELGADGPIADSDVSPKFATPLARATLAGFADAAGLRADGFLAVGAHAAGGLSRIWGALAARYDDADLAAFGAAAGDVRESYDRVAARVGVQGGGDLADVDPDAFTPPIARIVQAHRVQAATPDFDIVTAPNAVLSTAREDRDGCTRCGLCLHGCGRGSIYHAAQELAALRRHRNFERHGGVVVRRLDTAGGAQIVEGIRDGQPVRYRAAAVVLAAGTIATAALALRRIGLTGVPVRLESNPVGGIGFVVPGLIGRPLPDTSFGLGQLFYDMTLAPDVAAAGVFYGADTLPLAPVADRLPFTRPVALAAARAIAPALVLATAYLPGRLSDNRLVVEGDGDTGRIRITGHQTDSAERWMAAAFDRLAHIARRRGAWAIPGSRQLLMPGADAHPAGTLPMGGTGPAATEQSGELRGAPGVYVADGAALPLLSARHPTLTIMANADRIGRALARRMTVTADIARVS